MRARRNPLSKNEKTIRVIVEIKPGLALPLQKAAWRRFWGKLISEVKSR